MTEKKQAGIYWFPGDWRKDPGVQSLSFEARGIWFEILMLMAESSDRGKLTLNGRAMTADEGSKILGMEKAKFEQTVKQIVNAGVASIEQKTGILFNRRMVREQELRQIRAEAGRIGGKHSGESRRSKTEAKTNIPNLTLPNHTLKQESKPLPGSHEKPHDSPAPASNNGWTPGEVWIKNLLEEIRPSFPVSVDPLLDREWWALLSHAMNGLAPQETRQELYKMAVWIRENPSRRPTQKGTRRFVRSWLIRAAEQNRRVKK